MLSAVSAFSALSAAIVSTSACGGVQSALNAAGPQAGSIARLTWWFFGTCAVVYLLTMGALAWAIFRRRSEIDDAPETAARLGWIVAGAAALTVVTLVVLAFFSVAAGRRLFTPFAPGAITVDVVGHRWWWEFKYRDVTPSEWVDSPNELHIPVGVPVVVNLTSADVIHSFWVPNLFGKRDLIPGISTQTWIQADKAGVYRGQCAEFCGHQHAHMAFLLVAEPMDDFQRWIQHQRTAAPPPATDVQRRGHDVFVQGPCVMCHTIRGTSAGSRIGPDLTDVMGRQTLAAATLPATPGHLAGWIADSQSIKPGNRMPPNLLRGDDLQALVAYLETLR
jgi:cytochrome c oxidase subunit 2